MQHLIPFAAAAGPQCQQAIAGLKLPHLERLLQRLQVTPLMTSKPGALTPLHEKLAAQAQGMSGPDGLIPWAARDAQARGLTKLHGADGWAWVTPCHWTIHADHVVMSDPTQLALTHDDLEALWRTMEPYFAEDGITLFAQPVEGPQKTWLAHGAVFRDLPTASLERVSGQSVDAWMPRLASAKTLRRLQNEMQMLLYTHPLHDQRTRFKLPSINSFWVSGTGSPEGALPASASSPLKIQRELRAAALQDDATNWAFAWHALDSSLFAPAVQATDKGEPVQIILCGEHQAVALQHRPEGFWARLRLRRSTPRAIALLSTL